MADFKKLSDVEVVAEPTKSANVLIEEDGVIKKAPKTAVGGGADNFVIISIPYAQDVVEEGSKFIEGVTCNKTYDEVIEMYCAGEIDCAFVKAITPNFGLAFVMADEIALLNGEGLVHISDAASAECIGFTNHDIGMSIFYYRDGFSYATPMVPK